MVKPELIQRFERLSGGQLLRLHGLHQLQPLTLPPNRYTDTGSHNTFYLTVISANILSEDKMIWRNKKIENKKKKTRVDRAMNNEK
jgi:hypothetical protein